LKRTIERIIEHNEEEKNMDMSIIPWQEFLAALRQQQPAQLELWLRRWLFTNEGVILADHQLATVH
jgi:hypothetical protein